MSFNTHLASGAQTSRWRDLFIITKVFNIAKTLNPLMIAIRCKVFTVFISWMLLNTW